MAKPASGTALDTGNPLYTGLTNAWGILEGSGTTTADSKAGATATISGGVTWTTDADGPLLVGDGVSGKALLASVLYLNGETTGPWTVAWRATQTGGSTPIEAIGSLADGYAFRMLSGSYLEVHTQSTCQFTGVTDFSSLDDYMVVADGSTNISLYHNGTLVSTLTGKDTRCGFKAFVGNSSTNFFGGQFSYLYVWGSTALTGTNAATLHSNPYALFVGGDITPPVVSSANIDSAGTTLTINFTETGSPPVLPASSVTGFTLKQGGVSTGTLTSTAISGTTYTATIARKILMGETTFTLDYTPGNVTDSASPPNAMVSFTGTSVTNNSTAVPTLSSPSGTGTGSTTATLAVTTDTGFGTLYAVVSTSSTAPSVAQVKAGEDHTGSAADFAHNQSVSASGPQSVSATGLTASTTYYAYFVQTSATNDSAVSSSSSFATPASTFFTVSPDVIPESHVGSITLTLVGTGTTWTSGSTVSITNMGSTVTKGTWTRLSNTSATLTVTVGIGTGTYKVTVDSVDSFNFLSVHTPTFVLTTDIALVSTTPTITAIGYATVWTLETASTLFTKSGGTGASIASITVLSDTVATFVLTVGSAAATITVTDASTGLTSTFAAYVAGTGISIGKTALNPQSGSGPNLNGWSWTNVPDAYWAAMLRSVIDDNVSPYNSVWQSLMSDTQGPTIRTGFYGSQPDATGTAYGNMAVGFPTNHVPGSTPTRLMTYGLYINDSDPGPIPFPSDASIEGWPFGSNNADNLINGFVGVTNGSAAVTGSGTNFTQLRTGDVVCFAIYGVAHPAAQVFYTILSVTDDTHLTLTANYGETSHVFADTMELYGPFNRQPTYVQSQALGDSRAGLLVRDESTYLPTVLWEVWYPSYDPGPSGWQAAGAFVFDLATGAQRLDGLTSATAGGTPATPFVVDYEEAASGTIDHPLRCAIASGIGSANKCIWPCTHAAQASGVDFTAGTIPLGSVIRLNADWLAANRSSFPTIIQPVLDAANIHGLIVNDYTSGVPFEIDWTQDSRWNKADILTVWAIPVTAFELIDSVKPQYILEISEAPYTNGTPITFTISYVGDTNYSNANTNFDPVLVYLEYSTDAGANWTLAGGTVNLTTSSRSGTCTYTPGSNSNYLFRTYQASGVWWLPGAMVSAAVSTSARALTTVQDGRWDDPATWGDTPPADGDTATIAHAVTMIGDASIGDGTATDCLTIATGTLLVVGCKLTLRGNVSLGPTGTPSDGTATVARLSVVSSVNNAAGIEFDGNSGVTPTITIQYTDYLSVIGLPSYHSYIRTKSGSAGNNGVIINGQVHQSGSFIITYCDISNLGGATTKGINCGNLDSRYVPTGYIGYTMDNCAIDHCGICPYLSIGSESGPETVSVTNSVWTNPQDTGTFGSSIANGSPAYISIFYPPTTGTRLVSGCTFIGKGYPPIISLTDGVISECYFDDAMFGPIEQGQCAVMDGCFIQYQGGFETSYAGSMTNNFRLVSSASGDPVSSPGGDAHYDSTYAYNVHQSNSETNFFYSNAESQSQEIFMNVVNNIGLPATNGDESAALCALISRPDLATMYRFVVEHNTKFCHRQPLLFQEAELTGDFLSVRSNLGWNTGSNSLNTATAVGVPLLSSYLVQQAQNQGYTWMLDAGYSSVYDYNGWHNLRTVTAGTFTTPTFPVPTIPGATNHTDGTVYFTPMSGGSAPGTHDVVNVDPSFVDSTRNLQSWAVHKGYASSGDSDAVKTAAALAAIQANLTLTATDLLPWVRAGFKPTSGSYLNAGHDGEDIGCIVAGGITCLVSPYSPPSLPTNHSGNLTLWLVGTGTNWTGSPFGISGVVGCMLVSQTIYTPTVATITVTTGSTSGTLSITDGTFTTAVPVADPTLEVRPAQLTAGSGPVAIGLKGTNTAWYQETTAPLFTVTGGTGASLSAIVVTYSNGWATATLDPGSAAGTLTIHDAVSGTTATILVGSDAPTLVVSPTHDGIVDGGTTNITLTGTHTNWTTYNLTVPLFLSGAEFNGGTPIYNIIIISDTSATATIGHVTQTGVTTIVDQSTNASHSFTIDAAGVATTYTLSGPTSGVVSVASTNFTVTPDGTTSGTVTLHTTGSGTFLPGSTLTWTGDSLPKSFTYTPSSISGSPHSISITSSPVLIYTGSPISYTVNPASATSYTLTAPSPSEGQVGVASGNFIVQCDSSPASPVTITPNDGGNGGTFSPSSLLVSDSSTHAFTYTAASFGIKTISCTNNGGLTNPVSVDFQSYLLTVSPRSVAVDNGTVVSITATLFS